MGPEEACLLLAVGFMGSSGQVQALRSCVVCVFTLTVQQLYYIWKTVHGEICLNELDDVEINQ